MGSDSGHAPQAPAGRGLARSSSKMNLTKGSALGRSGSRSGLAQMASGALKPSLRRSPSRGQLLPSDPALEAPPTPSTPETVQDDVRDSAPPELPATAHTPSSSSSGSSDSKSTASLPLLKRSRSMNHIESLRAPTVSEGQKAVESISGKVALPPAPVQSLEGSVAPGHMAQHEISERGHMIQEHAAAEQASAQNTGSSRSPSTPDQAPSGFESPRELSPTATAPPAANAANAANAAPPRQSHKRLAPPLGPRHDMPSPRDDAAAQPEAERRVDYFSHDWNESDIAGSWRYIISRRQDMANSARLENASWRMWAKAKSQLGTVPPSTVNWLKDYDVTWLYGPLYHEPNNVYNSELPPAERAGSVSPGDGCNTTPTLPHVSKHGCYPKSILKKKTLAQLMLQEAHELEQNTGSGHTRSTTNYMRHHQYRPTPFGANRQMVADILNRQYATIPSSSGPVTTPAPSDPSSETESPSNSRSSTPGATPSRRPLSIRSLRSTRSGSLASIERHVHFNDRVEQCVALDPEENKAQKPARETLTPNGTNKGDAEAIGDDDEYEDEDEEDEEEDDAGLFLGLRRPSMIDMKSHDGGANIIAALPATSLKYDDDEGEGEDAHKKEEPVTVLLSSSSSSRRPGFNAHYQPHPVQTQSGPSYQIVDPNIQPVDFKAGSAVADVEEAPRAKVRPTASFG